MKRSATVFILGAILLAAACEKKTKQPVVETADGVEIVHNPDTPVHPGKTVVLEEELVIRGEDEHGKIRLFRPGRFAVNQNGQIYIADPSDQAIKVFDADGKYVKTIGSKGGGPGEFQGIIDLRFLPDGRFAALDFRSRRLSIFDENGEFLTSFNGENSSFNILLTTDSSITCDVGVYGENRQLFVKSFNFSGKELLSIGEFTPVGLKILQKGKVSFAIAVPYSPRSVFAGDQNRQWLYHCLNNKYLIEVYDRSGKLFRKIERTYEPVPYTEEEKSEFLADMKKNPNKVFFEMAKKLDLPKVKTVTEHMLVDDQGNLWVGTHEEREENGTVVTAWDIFDSNGYYDARVWLEFQPQIIRGGKVYTRVMDEESGALVIKRYAMRWVNR